MIISFKDRETERVFRRELSHRFSRNLARAALKKLAMLHAAETLQDLNALPGNRTERLTGDRKGQYSIRVNDQWRICFVWKNGRASDVELVDYH